jgi:hypothetical protein
VPDELNELLMTGAGTLTTNASVAEPVPPAFVALMVTLLVPEAVAVPEITPELVLTLNPAGNPEAL